MTLRALVSFALLTAAGITDTRHALGAPMPFTTREASMRFSLDERVHCQWVIEEVYWRHRLWPRENPGRKPSLAELVSREQVVSKVEDGMKKSAALDSIWGAPITAAELQAEIDRMARETMAPAILQELLEALGNDGFLFAECLARPVVADRRLRQVFDQDPGKVSPNRAAVSFDEWWSEESRVPREAGGVPAAKYSIGPMGAGTCTSSGWLPISKTNSPGARTSFAMVWTGAEVFIHGGQVNSKAVDGGARYDPATDVWTAIATAGGPGPRMGHTAVWTGTEVIVWGGGTETTPVLATGARYSPSSNTWRAVSGQGAPQYGGGNNATSAWSGTELLVFTSGMAVPGFNGRYNPSTDSWRSMSNAGLPSFFGGQTSTWASERGELLVWGGISSTSGGFTNEGARYDPGLDKWTVMTTSGAPEGRMLHVAAWSGSELIVWGGLTTTPANASTGGSYDPATNKWKALPTSGAPSGRASPAAVWTGSDLIIYSTWQVSKWDGSVYKPSSNSWSPLPTAGAPDVGVSPKAVWTGKQVVFWGNGAAQGGRYCPSGGDPLPCSVDCTATLVGVTGATATFRGTVTTANCSGDPAFNWTFGDGETSPAQNPTHTYTKTGDLTWSMSVTVNGVTCSRQGTVKICGYSLDPVAATVPAAGQNGLGFQVQTTSGCPWSATSAAPDWLKIASGSPGNGSGRVTLNVLQNTGGGRQGKVTVAGKDFTVTQQSSIPANIQLTGIEVTQAVQDLNNSVPLIAGKSTYVRVHVKALGSQDIKSAGGTLTVSSESDSSKNMALTPANLVAGTQRGTITVKPSPQRVQLDDSFLFVLPAETWLSGKVNIRFELKGGEELDCKEPTTNDPTQDCKVQVDFKAAKTLKVKLSPVRWTRNETSHEPTEAELEDARRELANTIPAILDFSEAGARIVLPAAKDKTAYPDVDDVLDELVKIRTLDGCGWEDSGESSCGPYHFGIWNYSSWGGAVGRRSSSRPHVLAGLQSPFDLNPPHEFGHSLGRSHTNYNCRRGQEPEEGGCLAGFCPLCSSHQPEDGTIGGSGADTSNPEVPVGLHRHGRAGQLRVIGPSEPDLMSYGTFPWPSPFTYRAMKTYLDGLPGTSRGANLFQAPGTNTGSTPAVLICGRYDFDRKAGILTSILGMGVSDTGSSDFSGAFIVATEDSGGRQLSELRLKLERPFDGSSAAFCEALPWDPSVKSVVLKDPSGVLASRSASNNLPTVQISFPNGGESLTGSSAAVTWTASDADGDPLTFLVQYSGDGGTTWTTLTTNSTSSTFDWDLTRTASTEKGLIRVFANDGFYSAESVSSAVFRIGKHNPLVSIQRPEGNLTVVKGATVLLEGRGWDPEDGRLSGTSLTWSSSISGTVGTGASLVLSTANLATGSHTITLTAKDKDQQSAAAHVALNVVSTVPVLPPVLSVAPASLEFTASTGAPISAPAQLFMRNPGDGTLSWTLSSDVPWVRLASTSGTGDVNLKVQADATGLGAGTHEGTIAIAAPGALQSPQNVRVRLFVEPIRLSNGHISVDVSWRSQYTGQTGKAVPLPQGDGFAYFYFSDPNNPEVFVKVLDFGASSPYLVFFAGLTDYEYTVTFTNLSTGKTLSFTKPAGSFAGGANNQDLPHIVAGAAYWSRDGLSSKALDGARTVLLERGGRASSPRESTARDMTAASELLLSKGRVAVTVDWRSQYSGQTGQATPLPQKDEFGFFYFSDKGNPEVFVKVLDFGSDRPYLVFYAGLTDFEYTVTYKNVLTGQTIAFKKEAGSFNGGADNSSLKH